MSTSATVLLVQFTSGDGDVGMGTSHPVDGVAVDIDGDDGRPVGSGQVDEVAADLADPDGHRAADPSSPLTDQRNLAEASIARYTPNAVSTLESPAPPAASLRPVT